MPSAMNILLLHGGESSEREISLKSGNAVAKALQLKGHKVTLCDTKTQKLTTYWLQSFDIVFVCLHGGSGENGAIQQILEKAHVPFTSCGSISANLTMSKWDTKVRLQQSSLPVPMGKMISRDLLLKEVEAELTNTQLPLVIKPDHQGSSYGVSLVTEQSQILPAIKLARQYDHEVLVEQAVLGAEWTVGVIDRQAFPPLKITSTSVLFDYQAKYTSEQTRYEFAQAGEQSLATRLQEIAVKACQATSTRGIVRVDFRLDTLGQPFILEINSVPGMTDHSLVPKAASALGWDMSRLCEEALKSAWNHHQALEEYQTLTA
jgi:D-alanine-D-alanine ligase